MMINHYNFAIDLRYAEKKNSGLTRFSKNLFLNLIKEESLKKKNFLLILPPKSESDHLEEFKNLNSSNKKIIYWNTKRNWKWKLGIYYFDFKLFLILKRSKIDTYINPFMDPPFVPGIDVISTIHDITFLKVNNYFNKFDNLKKFIGEIRILITILISKKILTVSYSTRKELIKRYFFLPKNLKTKLNETLIIPNGIIKPIPDKNICLPKYFPKYYFLYVGDRRPHKNIEYLIELISKLRKELSEDVYLVIAGSKQYKNKSLEKKILNNQKFIFEFEEPKDNELFFLYKNCKAFFLLSISEGFGIPLIEAAVQGAKLIANDIPPLREIGPKNTLFIKCKSTFSDIKKIKNYLLKKNNINADKTLSKFQWKHSSKKLSAFLLKIC